MLEARVGDRAAALQLELVEVGRHLGDQREGGVVDAKDMAGALERDGGEVVEAEQEGLDMLHEVVPGFESGVATRRGVHGMPPLANQRAIVAVGRGKLGEDGRQALRG